MDISSQVAEVARSLLSSEVSDIPGPRGRRKFIPPSEIWRFLKRPDGPIEGPPAHVATLFLHVLRALVLAGPTNWMVTGPKSLFFRGVRRKRNPCSVAEVTRLDHGSQREWRGWRIRERLGTWRPHSFPARERNSAVAQLLRIVHYSPILR